MRYTFIKNEISKLLKIIFVIRLNIWNGMKFQFSLQLNWNSICWVSKRNFPFDLIQWKNGLRDKTWKDRDAYTEGSVIEYVIENEGHIHKTMLRVCSVVFSTLMYNYNSKTIFDIYSLFQFKSRNSSLISNIYFSSLPSDQIC